MELVDGISAFTTRANQLASKTTPMEMCVEHSSATGVLDTVLSVIWCKV